MSRMTRRGFLAVLPSSIGAFVPRRNAFTEQFAMRSSLAKANDRSQAAPIEGPVAKTNAGKIRGFIDDDIHVFKRISYGADTAPRRFMKPIPPEPWSGCQRARKSE
jgi:para-nitrobenzyl esterase